ncbi:trypsin-like serine protease [Nocardia sp. 2]|uniref:Trypsin-like serine protease n=1 Tax=Nocardia acididurans TaxID=2802282 RepID=A0ABS1LX92_9NOCA|nr:S1 family peptidase [Nocardia acididurans]MBL1072937.1 trypsin-like serine protease [Nocardia acididurans]
MLLPRMRNTSPTAAGPRSLVRRAAIAAAALLVAGPMAASAQAEPAAPGLPAELIAAITRDLRISPEQYLQRSDLAQQVAAFSATAQRQYPDLFAGAWLDESGQAIVALAGGPGIDAARKAVQDAGYTVKDVAKSETALRGEKNAFAKWLEGQPASVASQVRGVAVDTVNNAIAVRVDQGGLQLPGFAESARVIVMAAPPVAGEDTEVQRAADIASTGTGPIAAGDAYASIAGRMSLRCSTGFNGTDGSGAVVNITAGHCNPNIAATGGGNSPGVYELVNDRAGNQMGTFEKSILGNQDYSIVSIDNAFRDRFSNNLVRVPNAAPIAVTGVAVPVVGAPVCKSGSRTGFSCGTVNAVDQTVQVGDRLLTQSFSANICALPGDSGGPIVTGTLALGISSASSVADYPICEIPNLIGLLTGNTPQLFAQPVSVVLSDNPGLRVRTN